MTFTIPPAFTDLLNSFHTGQIEHNLPELASFNDVVQKSALLRQAIELGTNPDAIWNLPRPFIGLGNPNASILIIGKKLAIDPHRQLPEQDDIYWNGDADQYNTYFQGLYLNEVFLNSYSWFRKLNGLDISPGFLIQDPAFPPGYCELYNSEKPGGHTWAKINRVINFHVNATNDFTTNDPATSFFKHVFLTQLNLAPAVNDEEVNGNALQERFDYLRTNSFYNGFKTIIFACATYLNHYVPECENQIINSYNVHPEEGFQVTRNIRRLYSSADKKIIVTNQLSGAAGWSNEELEILATLL